MPWSNIFLRMNSSPIIVISGCTASGKSDIALKLAKRINGVIINADSRQVYEEISIGTAKPKPDKVENNIWYIDDIPHYLYSYVSVKEKYNLYRYQQDVFKLLKSLPRDVVPILVGGTGLYIDSVVFNYELKKEKEEELEKKFIDLDKEYVKKLQKEVGKEILDRLNKSDRNNPHRLQKIIQHGLPSIKRGKVLNHIYFFLDMKIEILKERSKQRVENMFVNGLLEENEMSRKNNLEKYPALRTIGYQEFDKYFDKEKTLEEVKEDIITHTNQYAKRQRTWFRRNKKVIYVKEYRELEKRTLDFLSKKL